jgi:hypothetical protein
VCFYNHRRTYREGPSPCLPLNLSCSINPAHSYHYCIVIVIIATYSVIATDTDGPCIHAQLKLLFFCPHVLMLVCFSIITGALGQVRGPLPRPSLFQTPTTNPAHTRTYTHTHTPHTHTRHHYFALATITGALGHNGPSSPPELFQQ